MIIYEISLADDVKVTPEVKDKLKLLAYLVYGELLDYDSEAEGDILFKKNVCLNEIYDGFRSQLNGYEFEHEDFYTGDYEPFMIDDVTFGFTAYSNRISDEELAMIIREMRGIVQLEGNLQVKKVPVVNEKDRKNIIGGFYGKTGHNKVRVKKGHK